MRRIKKTIYAKKNIPDMPSGIKNHDDIFNLVEYYMGRNDIVKTIVSVIEYGDSTYMKYLVYVSGDGRMLRWLETFTTIHMRENTYQIDVYNSIEKANKFMEDRAGEFI